jgi:hypothetical protein
VPHDPDECALREDVTAVARVMPRPRHPAAKRRERVLVQSEMIEIPYRIYNPEPPADAIEGMSDRQKLLAGCVYSSHQRDLGRLQRAMAAP